jgi:hypothetical protein
MRPEFEIPFLKSYAKDCRRPIEELFEQYLQLVNYNWLTERIYLSAELESHSPPIIALRTPQTGPALWVIAGIHGEEPAGPNAIAENLSVFIKMQNQKIPMVLLPLCNPEGYFKNWRYYHRSHWLPDKANVNVDDCEHLLPDLNKPHLPRLNYPSCPQAAALSQALVQFSWQYPPALVIDLHEDIDITKGSSYVFYNGEFKKANRFIRKIATILERNNFSLIKEGQTFFSEKIMGGVVFNSLDGSISEFLSAREIIVNGQKIAGPAGKSVLAVETSINGVVLSKRVAVHGEILQSLPEFWIMAQKDAS